MVRGRKNMLVKCKYFGFYPLGSEVEINNIKIMKEYWNEYNKFIIPIGKKNVVSPFMQPLYYIISNGKIIFFVAIEYGLGQYHIFTISHNASKRLKKKIVGKREYKPIAVAINKVSNDVDVYGRKILGTRDQNYKCSDNFFKVIDTKVYLNYIQYTFTNNGEDRYYLEVYNAELVETSQNYVIIGKASKVVWRWRTKEEGHQIIERRLLKNNIENKYIWNNQETICYYR